MEDTGDQISLLKDDQPQATETELEIRPDPEVDNGLTQHFDYLNETRSFTVQPAHYDFRSDVITHDSSIWTTSSSTLHHMFIAAAVAGSATLLALLLPVCLVTFNVQSDAYCALTIYSICSWLLLALLACGLKIWKRSLPLKPSFPPSRLARLGFYYGLCGISIFYGRDRFRVECHLQDPLAAIVLPAAVVCHFYSAKVDSVSKFVCIASAIIGLFICVDFQIWDEFNCHGDSIKSKWPGSETWTADEHIIWTMVYVAGFLLLALFFNTLEWEIKNKMSLYSDSGIPMMMRGGFTNVALIEETMPSTSEDFPPVQIVSPSHRKQATTLTLAHAVVICMWIQLASTVTILGFFWTDLFSFLGKAGSWAGFQQMVHSGFATMFGYGSNGVASLSWPFVVFYVIFLISIVYLIITASDCSSPYIVGVLTLALPLSTLWWSFFLTGNIVRWAPSFSGETGFTVVGFPIMIAALILYKYYTERERVQII